MTLSPDVKIERMEERLNTRIQFLEADKRIQDLLIAARDAEIASLREALGSMLHIFDRGLTENMLGRKICDEARAALEEWPTTVKEWVERQE